jgi:hypothetical protein
MTVVSNTSPIVNLAAIGQLTLLRPTCGRIMITQAVYLEIAVTGAGQAGRCPLSNHCFNQSDKEVIAP